MMVSDDIFLDFQKASDNVNHKIFISKLEHYRIRGMPFKLSQNYLMNRTQFVEMNKISSSVLPINYEVLQGQVFHWVGKSGKLEIFWKKSRKKIFIHIQFFNFNKKSFAHRNVCS